MKSLIRQGRPSRLNLLQANGHGVPGLRLNRRKGHLVVDVQWNRADGEKASTSYPADKLVGGVLTWSRAAELLGQGVPEMQAQLELATRVVERYGRTGRIGFSGVEYQAATFGVDVMDALASVVDQVTATAAAEWGELQVNKLAAHCRLLKAA
jgi:hypothetical protein